MTIQIVYLFVFLVTRWLDINLGYITQIYAWIFLEIKHCWPSICFTYLLLNDCNKLIVLDQVIHANCLYTKLNGIEMYSPFFVMSLSSSFQIKCGLWPLNPYFFLLMRKNFNSITNIAMDIEEIEGILLPTCTTIQMFSQYVDNTSLTINGKQCFLSNMVILLDKFKVISRVDINDITKYWDIGKVQGELI